jgi:ribonuclease HI
MNLTIHFDGSCWPNPGGLARFGYTVKSFGTDLNRQGYGVIGESPLMSNNHAELYALAEGLEWAVALTSFHKIELIKVIGDSEVAVRLMSGIYRANASKLYYPQWERAKIIQAKLEALGCTVSFEWCPREENQECDDLSKMPVVTASAELIEDAEGLLS